MNDTSGDTSSSTSSTGTGSTGTGTGTGIGSGELKSAWHRLCDTLRDSAGYVFDDQLGVSPSEQAEGLRHHLRLFTSTLQHSFESHDPKRPELGWTYPQKVGQDCPDSLYMRARLDLRNSYRLTGLLDSVRYLGFTLMTLRWDRGEIVQHLDVDSRDLTDVGDGTFDLIISGDPDPGNHRGDWRQVICAETDLLVRQFFSDWNVEHHAQLHIECLDADPLDIPTRLNASATTQRLGAIADETAMMGSYWTRFGASQRDRGEVNSFDHVPSRNGTAAGLGGSVKQHYGQCWFEVAADEALLLEVIPPECLYWGIQVGDAWYQSLDYVNLLATLNDSQAYVSEDGVVQAVVSHRDPGIQNWIELGGCMQGSMTYRWNNATSNPVPSMRLVPFDELHRWLRSDTPKFSAAQRRTQRRERRCGALRRFMRG